MEALYRDLGDRYDLHFADMNPDRISPSIPSNRKHIIPAALDDDFINALVSLCQKINATLLVPGVDEELTQIWAAEQKFSPTKLFLPKASFVESMLDKLSVNQIFAENGFDVPSAVRADNEVINLNFPVLVKPRWGRGSRNIFRINDPDKLPSFLASIEGDLKNWLVQECIAGNEYTVQVISAPDSSLLTILPILALEKRGSTTVAEMRSEPEIVEYCKRIHAKLDPRGTYNIQLIKSPDGRIRCFEVNPRVSTTFCMAVRAGHDPFHCFCEGSSAPAFEPDIPSMSLVRHWFNEISVN